MCTNGTFEGFQSFIYTINNRSTMKKSKRIPVNIPLEYNGNINDVIQDFINTMQTITGGVVDLECDVNGSITIYFEDEPHQPIINKNNPYDLEHLLYPDSEIQYRANKK
jgi:hypothetical protein